MQEYKLKYPQEMFLFELIHEMWLITTSLGNWFNYQNILPARNLFLKFSCSLEKIIQCLVAQDGREKTDYGQGNFSDA